MLTAEQIQENKIAYLNILSKLNVDLTDLSKYLDDNQFFYQPFSTKHLGNYPGGLCLYSLRLYSELSQLVNAYCPGTYSEEDIIKVALFKYFYKIDFFETYLRNVKNSMTGQWEQVQEYKTKDIRPIYGDLGMSSYLLAKRFLDFKDEQIFAICYSSLGIENGFKNPDIYRILETQKLVVLTHMAEMATSYLN